MQAIVVDDSHLVRYALKRFLETAGFDVTEANDGREALTYLAKTSAYEVAFVDWHMPEMNGLDFVRLVRANRRFDSMKIVMVTMENDLSHIEQALAAGATEYVMKPFSKDIILDKLRLLELVS